MINESLFTAYRFHRSNYPCKAIYALPLARHDVANSVKRYSYRFWWQRKPYAAIGAPFAKGLRWVDDPESIGFRFVGFADEIARNEGYSRAIDHKGWFTFPDGDTGEVLRGAVYQLPARNGKPVYFPAYREGSEGRKGWQDNAGGAVMDFSDTLERRQVYYETPWDAAKAADGIAERQAEKSREFYEADAKARQWDELATEAEECKESARSLIKAIRESSGNAAPLVCQTLRAAIKRHLRDWCKALEKREALADDFYFWDDGKRVDIAEFWAKYA